jgi:hypothetical protein
MTGHCDQFDENSEKTSDWMYINLESVSNEIDQNDLQNKNLNAARKCDSLG